MAGYWNRPEETARVLQGGWLHTGDIGFLDEEGELFALDRREDLIVSGGENVYPAEVEGVLLSHRKVAEAGVVGVRDATWGQTVSAFVVPKPGSEPSEEELVSHCRLQLAGFKVPRRIRLIGSLPRTASGKLRRGELIVGGSEARPVTRR
jgi:O-succinylbenzoic acid--CoA ligase